MRQDELIYPYDQFFNKSEEGKYFVDYVKSFIDGQHDKAENDPDHARDYAQSARGAREILNHISSVTTITKRISNIEE